jgi:hypothetical protein
LSEDDRKLVVMESFSEVVYLARMPAFLAVQGSKVSSTVSEVAPSCFYNNITNKKRILTLANMDYNTGKDKTF